MRMFLTIASLPLVLCLNMTGHCAEKLDQAAFEKLHRELRPAADATWRSVPWKISLLDAQADAAKSKKPIFIWAMDGHPLGCT